MEIVFRRRILDPELTVDSVRGLSAPREHWLQLLTIAACRSGSDKSGFALGIAGTTHAGKPM